MARLYKISPIHETKGVNKKLPKEKPEKKIRNFRRSSTLSHVFTD